MTEIVWNLIGAVIAISCLTFGAIEMHENGARRGGFTVFIGVGIVILLALGEQP